MKQKEVYDLVEQHARTKREDTVKRTIRKVGSFHNAEDAVQEAYARALQYWDSYELDGDFDNWFESILRNVVRAIQSETILRGMTFTEEPVDVIEPQSNPRQWDNVVCSLVQSRLAERPPHEKKILELALFKQYKMSEIAQLVPENHAHIRKIVQRFRDTLKEEVGYPV